ncbi:hypothetical protein, partial [Paracoccus fontiphilus]
SSLHEGYDEPETLCHAIGLICPMGADVRQRLQTIRAGFPCFCAALAGYVEATRDNDLERNRLCPPNTLPDTPSNWAEMQLRGSLATRAYGAEPDIASWANRCALNPARLDPSRAGDTDVTSASARLAAVSKQGVARMAELAGMSPAGAVQEPSAKT